MAKKGEPLKEKQDKLIKDLQDKAKKTGTITEERIKEVVREVIAKGKDVKEKSQKLVNDLKEKAARSDKVKIEETLKKLYIPTKEELREINTKLDELIEKLEKESDNN